MAEFCTNCGTPLSGAFCGRCGHRAQSAGAPAQPTAPTPQPVVAPTAQPVAAAQPTAQPVPPQPTFTQPSAQPPITQQSVAQQPAQSAPQAQAAQPPKSSGGGKALLIVGGIVLVMVLGAFGAVLYGVHWVKHKVSSITGGAIGGSQVSVVSQGNACKLLSTSELQQALGVAVERSAEIMDGNEPGCAYYTNPAAFSQLQKLAVEQARRDSEKASKDPSVNTSTDANFVELMKHTKEMEGMVKGLGLTQPDKDGKVFSFTVDRSFDGGNWTALRATMSIVPGFEEINGVGDHAMIGSFGHLFYMVKGNSLFKLETVYVPEARMRGSDIANKIISHL